MMRVLLVFFVLTCLHVLVSAQPMDIREDGTVSSMVCGGTQVGFSSSMQSRGPVLYVNDGDMVRRCEWMKTEQDCFIFRIDGVSAELKYENPDDMLSFSVSLKNDGDGVFAPLKAGISLGVDTYMEKYPDWLTKYFPTLLMCERTHLYGYFQAPQGHLFGVACNSPVASWSVDYGLGYYDIPGYWFYGHRIEAVNIDMINSLPLPSHHPQTLWKLEPGESRTWTFSFIPIDGLETFEIQMTSAVGIPMIEMSRTSYNCGETAEFKVYTKGKSLPAVTVGNGCRTDIEPLPESDGVCVWLVSAEFEASGEYNVNVYADGYHSAAVICVNESWESVLRNARKSALVNRQKPSSHVESWYGFHTAFLAAKHFPHECIDSVLDNRFDMVYDKVFDSRKPAPKICPDRIQNTSSTIGMLVDRYQAYGRIGDLEKASSLADWLICSSQAPSGAYMNGEVRYTSVIYVAKSLMELYLVETDLGNNSSEWAARAQRHYDSIKKAVDELVASCGDFDTEGEITFEDGMVSCSALQIGLFALLQEDECDRKYYRDAMLKILNTHDCLTQLKISDGRRRGGTMRFWEAQYDVLMLPDMFCSPHGWSAWRAYATYYAYLLTLQERYLIETFNAAGAFANLIEKGTGKLRWAFIVDPYVRARQIAAPVDGVSFDDLTTGNPHPEFYGARTLTIGEQYIDMVSSWQPVNSQDNDVHEVFKFIEEAVLTNAFIVERADGSIMGYNCKASRRGNTLVVVPDEKQIVNLHCNLRSDYKVIFKRLR